MPDPESLLRGAVERLRDAEPAREGLVYRGAPDFVLRHGAWLKPGPWRREWKQGAPLMCYGNAIVMGVLHGWRYVEGYALAPTRQAFPHAWNLTPAGLLADTTWRNAGLAYCGVEFGVGRADDAAWDGDRCVLDDKNRGWPLFRQEWAGEPDGLRWEPSEAMRFMLAELAKKKGR